jgi:D-alanyl-D-alanine carboxypeptidase
MLKKLLIMTISLTIMAGCQANEVSTEQNENEPEQPVPEEVEEETNIAFPETHLEKTDEGANVEQLQNALNEIGYDIEVSGIYDEATTWAITDFQLQQEDIHVTGVYDEETGELLAALHTDEQTVEAGAGLPAPAEPAATDYGTEVIANPYDLLAIVNKEHALPEDYIPSDLVVPDVRFPFTEELPKKQLREIAADALEEMFEAADEDGMDLFAQSGYRSFERQEAIFAINAEEDGEDEANQYSARPGESEHQSGLAMDVTSPDVNYELTVDFRNTSEGEWVEENAAAYGFIIRYPEGKEDITGYQYEPWHLRYVGKNAAEKIMTEGITLEEYVGRVES